MRVQFSLDFSNRNREKEEPRDLGVTQKYMELDSLIFLKNPCFLFGRFSQPSILKTHTDFRTDFKTHSLNDISPPKLSFCHIMNVDNREKVPPNRCENICSIDHFLRF